MKYNYQTMYLSDPQALQGNLAQDWATLIKNIRIREDLYHQLLQHSNQIYQKQFINQDQFRLTIFIYQNNTLKAKIKQQETQMSGQEQQIIQKYEGLIISYENCIKLMTRIGAKVLQLLKTTSERVRSYDDSASSKFNRFKIVLMGILTQREKLNLQNAIRVVLDYCKHKMQQFLTKLQRNINDIKAGQFTFSKEEPKKMSSEKSIPQPKREEFKWKSECTLIQKHLRSQKFLKKKFKLYQSFYNVMLLSKHQPNEDIVGSIDTNTQRIYLELLNRNKQNMNHIVNFRTRYEELQYKLQNFEQKINQLNEIQNKSIGFILKTKKQPTQQSLDNNDKDDYFRFIATEIETNIAEKHQPSIRNHMKKISITRTKLNNSPQTRGDDFPILNCKINKQWMGSLKTDSSKYQKHQSIKSRLPDIKRGSLDQKINLFHQKTITDYKESIDNIQESGFKQSNKRQSFFREERIQSQRTKMILKSVQVGLDISNKKSQRFCKEQQLSSKQRKKTDTTLQSTIYMRKTLNKYIDNKLNLFF